MSSVEHSDESTSNQQQKLCKARPDYNPWQTDGVRQTDRQTDNTSGDNTPRAFEDTTTFILRGCQSFLKRCLASSAVLTKPASVNLSATALNKSPVRHFLLSRRLIMSTSFRRREKDSLSSSYQRCQLCPFCARFFKERRLLNLSRVRTPIWSISQ